jgi:ATP-dependent DNA ligase
VLCVSFPLPPVTSNLTTFTVKVFDLLYLNGQSLLNRPTSFRKRNMRGCLKEITGRIEFAIEFKGKTAKDVRTKMDEVMEARGEGLVIKHPNSKYVLNGRNMDWIKVRCTMHCVWVRGVSITGFFSLPITGQA